MYFTLPFQPSQRVFIHHPSGMQYVKYEDLIRYKDVSRIQYNTRRVKNFLIVDLDDEDHATTFQKNPNIPQPHIVVSNKKKKFGKHLIWVLDAPVWANTARSNLWLKISKELTFACGGDEYFTFHIGKNFFNRIDYEVLFNDIPNYSLDAFKNLARVSKSSGTRTKALRPRLIPQKEHTSHRNIELFNTVRKFAYSEIRIATSVKYFKESVQLYAYKHNNSFSEPLEAEEVLDTIKSIVRYCIKNKRALKASKKNKRKLNIMENIEVSAKQKLGAEYTNAIKSEKFKLKIKTSILEMKIKSLKITVSSVAKYAQVSRTSVNKYRDFLR